MKKGVILTSLVLFFLMSVIASEGFAMDCETSPEDHVFSKSHESTAPENEREILLYEDTEEMEGRSRIQSNSIAFNNNQVLNIQISGNFLFTYKIDITEPVLIFSQSLRAPPFIHYSVI